MKHLIIDCETMSEDARDGAIIDISAFVFTNDKMLSDKPYTMNDYKNVRKFKLSLKDQISKYKYKVSEGTKQFWLGQSKEAQSFIKPTPDDLSLEEFGTQFLQYLKTNSNSKYDRWWSRSNTFDPICVWRVMDDLGLSEDFHKLAPHWLLRDTRSFIDGALNFPKKNGFIPMDDEALWNSRFILHDSAWDVLADVLRIQAILRTQQGLTV